MTLRAGILQAGLLNQSSAQVIDGSLKFDSANDNNLRRSLGSAGNRRTWTWSAWVKKTSTGSTYAMLGSGTNSTNLDAIDFNGEQFRYTRSTGGSFKDVKTNAVHRDSSGFYHVVCAVDTTQSTSSQRVKLFVNGAYQDSLAAANYPSENEDTFFNSTEPQVIGRRSAHQTNSFDGFMSQVYFIEGLALGPGYFGFTDPLTGTWRPKKFKAEGTTVNDGTVWSGGIPGNVLSGYPATNAFDGNLSTFVYADNASTMTWTAPKKITGQLIEVYAYAGGNWPILKVNGKSTGAVVGGTTQHNVWVDVTDLCGGNLETIQAFGQNIGGVDRSSGWSAVRVDGVTLIDSTTQNLAYGTNGFYLPMDGNSPIGEDKSGNGNNWEPKNFGGSNSVDKATGALPILEGPGGAVANVATRTDANASSLVLALPLVGSANDVSNQINSGSTTKTVTVNSAAPNSTYSNFYGGSYYFNGSSTLALSSLSGSNITDFTFESWIYLPNTSSQYGFFSNQTGDNNANTMRIGTSGGSAMWMKIGSNSLQTSSGTVPSARWFHLAVTRSGSTVTIYLDGINSATMSTSDYINASGFYVGVTYPTTTFRLNGYMQDVRFYTSAKYTSNFVPASLNPDILPDTPSGVSGGSKLAKITDGAVGGFETTSDYLSLAASSDFEFTGDHTIEFFVYHNTLANDSVPYSTGASGTPDQIYISSAGAMNYAYGQTGALSAPAGTIGINKWYHIAVSKSGTNLRMFVDGKIVASSSNHSSTIGSSSNGPRIGARRDGYHPTQGFISNLRVVKGSAVYTSEFTPPTAPLTNVTNTKLLCCQSNTSAVDTTVVPGTAPNTRNWSARSNWNSGGTLTNASSYPLTAAFDGNLSTTFAMSYAGGMIWTAPSTISFSSSIEVYVNSSIGTGGQGFIATISGVQQSKVDLNAAGSWETLYSGSGTFDKLEITRNNGGNNNNLWISAIRVDGTVLIDAITGHGDTIATNFNPFNTDIKTVLGQETGYATWNPLKMGGSDVSMSEGNLFWRTTSNGPDKCTHSTIGMDSGKFYWENEIVEATATAVGIANVFANDNGGPALAHNWMYYSATGQVYLDGSASSYGDAYNTNGTIIGVAFDRDNLTLEFYKNGVSQGKLTSISGLTDSETYFAMCGDSGGASQSQVRVNFGQKPFKFPPPDGFQPLNAANNRPETVIARSDQYFGNISYSGTSASTATVTSENIKFTPDFVWCKSTSNSEGHALYDSVRGGENILRSNTNEKNVVNANNLKTFIRGGFTTGNNGHVYYNGYSYASWMWKAGGNKGTFNVDDVGYASASDVNMSVDALSNKTQNWSGNATGGQNVGRAFDGTGPRKDHYSHTSGSLTVNFSPAISGRIIVYGGAGGAGARTFTLSDGSSLSSGVVYDTAPYYSTLDFGVKSNITSLTCSNGYTLYGISLDGKLLVDSGLSVNVPSIAPSGCSVGTKQGFSILKYTGSGSNGKIAHGLSQAPDFFFGRDLEDTSNSRDWIVYHKTMGSTGRLKFVGNASISESSTFFRDGSPTDSLISVGTSSDINSTNDYIMYCWHNVPGLQKFGGYTGNGSDNGPFVETGFRPALVWTRAYSSNSNNNSHWLIYDTLINTYNESSQVLYANITNGVNSHASMGIDILSNGFRLKADTAGYSNYNGWSYVYCAWAEAPAFNLYGGQSNAR